MALLVVNLFILQGSGCQPVQKRFQAWAIEFPGVVFEYSLYAGKTHPERQGMEVSDVGD